LKKLSVEELMNVEVISVSKRPEKLSETASAIQVITAEDIRRSGASNIPEALRLAHNLHVAQKGSHAWGIAARGFNTELANKLLVLIDGRTVYTPLFSGVFWDRQDYLLEDIDRIEVISGPGSTLWGANAVNGVINIITKKSKDTQGLYLEAGGGPELKGFTSARYGGKLASNASYRVYGKYFDRGSQVLGNGRDASDSWHMGQGGFRIDAETSPQNELTFQGDFYSGDESLLSGGSGKVTGGNILGRWSHAFSDESEMTLQFYYDRTHLATPVPAFVINSIVFAPSGTLKDDLDTYDVDFQHHFRVGARNHFVWGLGYRFTDDVVSNSPGLGFFPPVLGRSLFSGFVLDEIRLRRDLFFTVGSKLEHNDYTGFELEPSARLQWNLANKQILWAAASRAVRMPSRIDRDLSQPAPPHLVVLKGSPDFISETVVAYELGYRAQLGSKLATSVAAFYNDYDHLRSTSITPLTLLPFFFANNLQGKTYGVELSATYQVFDRWRLHAGYTPLKEQIRIKPGQMDLNNALNETADPRQQVFLRSSIDVRKNVELDAKLRWVDSLRNNNGPTAGTVPSYFELDARLGWHPTEIIEFSVTGQNLLHDRHPEYAFPSPTREEIERSIYGKIAFHW
jgi:iron complex outermembrane receptor protein